ncbi:hypothetical protein M3J09_005374 [Ascochyta lentis]
MLLHPMHCHVNMRQIADTIDTRGMMTTTRPSVCGIVIIQTSIHYLVGVFWSFF